MEATNNIAVTERIHRFMDRKLEVYPELRSIQPKKAAKETVREPRAPLLRFGTVYFPMRLY